jgi:hypothetical protein
VKSSWRQLASIRTNTVTKQGSFFGDKKYFQFDFFFEKLQVSPCPWEWE